MGHPAGMSRTDSAVAACGVGCRAMPGSIRCTVVAADLPLPGHRHLRRAAVGDGRPAGGPRLGAPAGRLVRLREAQPRPLLRRDTDHSLEADRLAGGVPEGGGRVR